MSTLKNHVQLIGNVGGEPQITNLENGKKVARLSLATNEYYKNSIATPFREKLHSGQRASLQRSWTQL